MTGAPRLFPTQRPGTLRASRPDLGLGIAVAVISVAAATAAIYALKSLAPVVSLSVVYLPAVLVVSAYWGLGLGLFTSLISAAAFNFFHLPPVDRFTISDSRNWVALVAFVVVAIVVSTIAELARSRAAGGRSPPSGGRSGGRAGAGAAGRNRDLPCLGRFGAPRG